MKKIILIFNCLFFINLNAQIKNGEITYKKTQLTKKFTKEKQKKLSSSRLNKFSKVENQIIKYQKKVSFSLLFENNKSIFQFKKSLDTKGERFLKLGVGPDGRGTFYNSKKETLRQLNAYGQDFIVSKPLHKWIITNEKKKIGKYLCYKATLTEKIKTRKGVKKHLVTAWFSPEVNAPFGPLGYSGLPGLILELRARNYKYYASKIILNTNRKIQITKPTKGIKVTQEEFYDISIDTMKKIKRQKN